jgi:hypothetical protein
MNGSYSLTSTVQPFGLSLKFDNWGHEYFGEDLWGGCKSLDRAEELAHLRTPGGLTMNAILMFIVWGRVDARSS